MSFCQEWEVVYQAHLIVGDFTQEIIFDKQFNLVVE